VAAVIAKNWGKKGNYKEHPLNTLGKDRKDRIVVDAGVPEALR